MSCLLPRPTAPIVVISNAFLIVQKSPKHLSAKHMIKRDRRVKDASLLLLRLRRRAFGILIASHSVQLACPYIFQLNQTTTIRDGLSYRTPAYRNSQWSNRARGNVQSLHTVQLSNRTEVNVGALCTTDI